MAKPVIDYDNCTICGTCIDVCPMDVFTKDDDGKVIVSNPDECVGCRACEVQCPVQCIEVVE